MDKKLKVSIISLIIVIINYVLTRFIFFDLHQMKDFTDTMTLLSACLTVIFLLSDNILSCFVSSISNIIGFVLGYMFNTTTIDYITGNTNNFWLIWIGSYIILVILSMLLYKMFHMKHKQ